METESRDQLTSQSLKSRNKKIADVIESSEVFIEKINDSKAKFEKLKPFEENCEKAALEGNDISVCVRVRPMLEHEKQAKYFETIYANQSYVHAFEAKFGVKGDARIVKNDYNVDFAFGPEHSNDDIYDCIAKPIVQMGLQGGLSTLFAYGQTGSGKTFTITGLLNNLAKDLLNQRQPHIKLYLSMFELLGNECSDLFDKESKADILEDKFGLVNVIKVKEFEIESVEQFQQLLKDGFSHRLTATTFKNDTSSRSHAVCQIRIENTQLKGIENGKIFVIDLAGSENASDSQFHDKTRVKETSAINGSLMALKDCIRNRALAAINVEKFYHVPYRLSKLSLLLKDAFEVESRKLCKTVVIANVAPTLVDTSQSLNTLRYVTPLKIGQSNREKVKLNPKNPAHWNNKQLRNYVKTNSKDAIDMDQFCPFESGMQILRIPEATFVERIMKSTNPPWGEKRALEFYKKLWKQLIDVRTKERKQRMKPKDGLTLRQRMHRDDKQFNDELIERELNEKKDNLITIRN